MFRYAPLILKNSVRNRRRSLLTICSIAASLCLLGVLLAMYHALYMSEASPAQALRLVTRNRVSLAQPMPIAYREKIRQVAGIREVSVSQWFGGVYKDQRDMKNMFARFGIEPDKLFTIHPEFTMPEDQKRDFQRERTACIVGNVVAARLGFKVGDRITLQGDIFPVNLELTVRGIYESAENNETLYFHLDYLFESLALARQGFAGTFTILADSPESVPRVAAAVDEMFRNAPVQTRTESEQAFALSFVAFLGNVKMFLFSVCGAVTFTILLVSANTMAMSVRERIREVGVLKTLGFSRYEIMGIIVGEAMVISLIGGVIGCGLAALLTGVVRSMPAFISALKTLRLEPSVAAMCLAVALVIGLVSSFWPAWSASRTSIVESLRYSG